MKKAYAMLPLACGMAMLQGCQTLNRDPQPAMRVEPVVSIQHGDTTPDGLYKLGRSLQAQNKLDEAAQAFREAIAKDPEQVDARNALAVVYASQKRFDLAHAELHAILQKNADLAYVQNNLGYTYFLEKDYPSAIGALGKAIALDPGSARAFGNLSLVYREIGDPDKASAASLRAVALHASAQPAQTGTGRRAGSWTADG